MPRLLILLAIAACLFCSREALAVKGFYDQYVEMYVDKESEDEAKVEYAKLVKKAKCYICHQGKKKKNNNIYGDELKEFLSKKDGKDVEKIQEALKKVAAMPVDKEKKDGPKFGDVIAKGELPAGDLKDLKLEPKELEEKKKKEGSDKK